jgi:hypothetical protein
MKVLSMVSGGLLMVAQLLLIVSVTMADIARWYATCLTALGAMVVVTYVQCSVILVHVSKARH